MVGGLLLLLLFSIPSTGFSLHSCGRLFVLPSSGQIRSFLGCGASCLSYVAAVLFLLCFSLEQGGVAREWYKVQRMSFSPLQYRVPLAGDQAVCSSSKTILCSLCFLALHSPGP